MEEKLQAECFQWFWNNYPQYRGTLFAVPNGGKRSKAEANRFKATGVIAGVADLIWMLPNAVIFIELKTDTGKQSDKQKQFEGLCNKLGHAYVVVRSFDDFVSIIKNNLHLYNGI